MSTKSTTEHSSKPAQLHSISTKSVIYLELSLDAVLDSTWGADSGDGRGESANQADVSLILSLGEQSNWLLTL